MSTELQTLESHDNPDVTVTQFNGGDSRGLCVQLTQHLSHVQLTTRQARDAVKVLTEWLESQTQT